MCDTTCLFLMGMYKFFLFFFYCVIVCCVIVFIGDQIFMTRSVIVHDCVLFWDVVLITFALHDLLTFGVM